MHYACSFPAVAITPCCPHPRFHYLWRVQREGLDTSLYLGKSGKHSPVLLLTKMAFELTIVTLWKATFIVGWRPTDSMAFVNCLPLGMSLYAWHSRYVSDDDYMLVIVGSSSPCLVVTTKRHGSTDDIMRLTTMTLPVGAHLYRAFYEWVIFFDT